jgi:acetyl-CoA carboxylase carboxyltransferase component
MGMKEHADDLAWRRARAAQMGGDDAVARQHAAGKLTVRERIDRLFDKDTFTEFGIHATHVGSTAGSLPSSPTTSRSWPVRWGETPRPSATGPGSSPTPSASR